MRLWEWATRTQSLCVCNDHNEEMGPGGDISDLENPDTLKKKLEISDGPELGS